MLSTVSPQIDRFKTLILRGLEAWSEAGKVLAALVEEEGAHILAEVEKAVPGVNRDTLLTFIDIGRGLIYPALLLDDSPAAEHIAGLPHALQENIYTQGVELVVEDNPDNFSVDVMQPAALTRRDCLQVFHPLGRLRTAEEQKAWLAEEERQRLVRRKSHAVKPSHRPPSSGDRAGHDPDKAVLAKSSLSLEQLGGMSPLELLRHSLDQVQVHLMEARRHLAKIKPNSLKDDFISAALNIVGRLRFAANNDDL